MSWLDPVLRTLHLGRDGVMVLVDTGRPHRIQELVDALPHQMLCDRAVHLHDAPVGAVVLLVVHPNDLAALNAVRPVVASRKLRLVLWWESLAGSGIPTLRRGAPDFYDWVSKVVECPPDPPAWAVAQVRRDAEAGGCVWWSGPFLDEVVAAAGLTRLDVPPVSRRGLGVAREPGAAVVVAWPHGRASAEEVARACGARDDRPLLVVEGLRVEGWPRRTGHVGLIRWADGPLVERIRRASEAPAPADDPAAFPGGSPPPESPPRGSGLFWCRALRLEDGLGSGPSVAGGSALIREADPDIRAFGWWVLTDSASAIQWAEVLGADALRPQKLSWSAEQLLHTIKAVRADHPLLLAVLFGTSWERIEPRLASFADLAAHAMPRTVGDRWLSVHLDRLLEVCRGEPLIMLAASRVQAPWARAILARALRTLPGRPFVPFRFLFGTGRAGHAVVENLLVERSTNLMRHRCALPPPEEWQLIPLEFRIDMLRRVGDPELERLLLRSVTVSGDEREGIARVVRTSPFRFWKDPPREWRVAAARVRDLLQPDDVDLRILAALGEPDPEAAWRRRLHLPLEPRLGPDPEDTAASLAGVAPAAVDDRDIDRWLTDHADVVPRALDHVADIAWVDRLVERWCQLDWPAVPTVQRQVAETLVHRGMSGPAARLARRLWSSGLAPIDAPLLAQLWAAAAARDAPSPMLDALAVACRHDRSRSGRLAQAVHANPTWRETAGAHLDLLADADPELTRALIADAAAWHAFLERGQPTRAVWPIAVDAYRRSVEDPSAPKRMLEHLTWAVAEGLADPGPGSLLDRALETAGSVGLVTARRAEGYWLARHAVAARRHMRHLGLQDGLLGMAADPRRDVDERLDLFEALVRNQGFAPRHSQWSVTEHVLSEFVGYAPARVAALVRSLDPEWAPADEAHLRVLLADPVVRPAAVDYLERLGRAGHFELAALAREVFVAPRDAAYPE